MTGEERETMLKIARMKGYTIDIGPHRSMYPSWEHMITGTLHLPDGGMIYGPVPRWSKDPRAMMELVDEMPAAVMRRVENRWQYSYELPTYYGADTLPLAVCFAWIAWKKQKDAEDDAMLSNFIK